MSTLNGKLALITGASRGIGQAVAKRFALEGADLILAARSIQNLEKVDDEIKALNLNTSVTLVPIDLKHGLQIEEMIRSIASRFGKLDILIGNAGYLGTLTPLTHQNAEEWQEVLDINLTANWHLLRCADPLLKKSMHGRALFVTSGVGKHPSPYWGAYSVSKAALNHMVKMYAFENISSSVKANLIDPGEIRTQMLASAKPGINPLSLPHPDEITDIFVQLASPDCTNNGDVLVA